MFKRIAVLGSAGVLMASSALAAIDATATTDLNLRAGPSPQSEVIGVIPGTESVTVENCITGSQWCKVNYGGTEGWAYSSYLTAPMQGATDPVVVYDNRDALQIESVEYDGTREEGALVGGTLAGSLAAAAIGGPAAVAGAAIAGAAAGAATQPGDEVVTYIRENPTEPVYLDGEVVVGAGVPDAAPLSEVPGTDYRYIYVNGVPAIVGTDNTVVRVIR